MVPSFHIYFKVGLLSLLLLVEKLIILDNETIHVHNYYDT